MGYVHEYGTTSVTRYLQTHHYVCLTCFFIGVTIAVFLFSFLIVTFLFDRLEEVLVVAFIFTIVSSFSTSITTSETFLYQKIMAL